MTLIVLVSRGTPSTRFKLSPWVPGLPGFTINALSGNHNISRSSSGYFLVLDTFVCFCGKDVLGPLGPLGPLGALSPIGPLGPLSPLSPLGSVVFTDSDLGFELAVEPSVIPDNDFTDSPRDVGGGECRDEIGEGGFCSSILGEGLLFQ